MIGSLLWFALGLAALVRGGDWFVDGAVAMATRFRLPETLIGATVVSIGTTLPEVMVSVTSAASGHGELAYGNAVGSVLCNAALIAGLSVAVRPGESQRREAALPTAFFFLAAGLYCAAAYGLGGFGRGTGFALLALFALYLAVTLRRFRGQEGEREKPVLGGSFRREIALLLLGAAAIALGARLLVEHGTLLARALGVPEAVIGLTLVALRTPPGAGHRHHGPLQGPRGAVPGEYPGGEPLQPGFGQRCGGCHLALPPAGEPDAGGAQRDAGTGPAADAPRHGAADGAGAATGKNLPLAGRGAAGAVRLLLRDAVRVMVRPGLGCG